MKRVPLTRGMFALVDDCDNERIARSKWMAIPIRGYWYAGRRLKGRHPSVEYMHRTVMGLTDAMPLEVDHINGCGLDNQRCNLRLATPRLNQLNQHCVRGAVPYRGVHRSNGRFRSRLRVPGGRLDLGHFNTPQEAHAAYEKARSLAAARETEAVSAC